MEPLPHKLSRTKDTEGEASLVVRARQGDRKAEEELYRLHVKPVTGLVLRMLRDRSEAEDVVQDTFLQALTDLPQLDAPELFGRWVLKIAIRKVHRKFRRKRLLRVLGFTTKEDLQLDQFANDEMSADDHTELRRIGEVLGKLPADEQASWMLKHVEGYTALEIANLTGCSLSTAKRRLDAAETRLDAHLRGVR